MGRQRRDFYKRRRGTPGKRDSGRGRIGGRSAGPARQREEARPGLGDGSALKVVYKNLGKARRKEEPSSLGGGWIWGRQRKAWCERQIR